MRIAVDAMGGDFAPEATVKGALLAISELEVEVVLVGKETEIRKFLPKELPTKLRIIDASEKIQMDDPININIIRAKRKASLCVAVQLVKNHSTDALVSMGNTKVTVGLCVREFGLIPGIDRPAIAVTLPGFLGPSILLDAGAISDCTVENLLQFALMGKAYAETFLMIENPKIGLLSVGAESGKGSKLVRESYKTLSDFPINFIGNVEGSDLLKNRADVTVTDGSSGNIALKTGEGMIEYIGEILKDLASQKFLYRIALGILSPVLKKRLDHSRLSGAPLLGLEGICIIGHGRANEIAVFNAIRAARDAAESRLVESIKNNLSLIKKK